MQHQRGITLIELMIVLVVMAVLTAIAYPSYTNQVMKSRRADGIAALNHASMFMESWRSDNATYVGGDTDAAFPNASVDGHYAITSPAAATATAYGLRATAIGVQANDARCSWLSLTSQGTRGYNGSAPDADTCWGQ